ncbi:MAG: zf-HC2 domain-containing protein [Ignavibacteria bacterium]|nr:zf-HC2 domain-containing protein [Ignavibacteria bacterium]
MTHTEHQQSISIYIDNALSDKESATLFAHLAGCDECRTFMKISMRVHSHITGEELAEVPSSLDRRVLGSVGRKTAEGKRSGWNTPIWFTRVSIPLPAAASILFLIIVGSLLFSPVLAGDRQQRTDVPAELISKIPSALQRPF